MIRYPITDADLRAAIDRQKGGWFARADQRTAKFKTAGKYDEKTGIWSEIKPVYVRLQFNKCGFCERKLSDEERGLLDYDVEHFRPKSTVSAWPSAEVRTKRRISFATGDPWETGYYMLAYHPWNYLAACKPCNTALKGSHFPIAAARAADPAQAADPYQLGGEKPFLVYPLGDLDEDPAELITFKGNLPRPVHRSGHRHRRARVLIAFFELDTREDLLEDRAKWIGALWTALRLAQTGSAQDRMLAEGSMHEILSPYAPHSNCLQAFYRLAMESPTDAADVAVTMYEYLKNKVRKGP
jgi:hypothetical protein